MRGGVWEEGSEVYMWGRGGRGSRDERCGGSRKQYILNQL